MALHPKMAPYKGRKYIKILDRLVRPIEKDLASVGCVDFDVQLIEEDDPRSFAERFLSFRNEVHFERVLRIDAVVMERKICLLIPSHQVDVWPYTLTIPLRVPFEGCAAYEQGFARKHWVTEPKDETLTTQLQKLKLPKIRWAYKHRTMKYKVRCAFEILAGEAPSSAVWRVHSGYFPASFFGGHLAKVSSFVQAVPDLEDCLSRYRQS